MYEVEVKVRADHDAVRQRLDDLGAERRGTVRQVDTYYEAPHRDFAATDEALRIRRTGQVGEDGDAYEDGDACEDGDAFEGGGTFVTYKGPLVEDASKTRTEAETAVADGDAMAAVLDGLGFEPAATVAKARERYALDGYAVVLDAVDGLEAFVEVETEVSSGEAVEPARDGAYDVLETLGLDPDDQIRTSYLELLLDAGSDCGADNQE